ncbi:MAG: NYN domain-containing protein [Deltaproteobacteria bacterium]|nr:NYN domain-containing protein [Deltaproteobacteria bacterium]
MSDTLDIATLLALGDAEQIVACIAHSVDRPVLDAEVRRIAKGGAIETSSRPREELGHALVAFAAKDKQVRRALGKMIMQATSLERQKLDTFADATWREELAPYLTQRRSSAKFLLAALVLAVLRGEPWHARATGLLAEIAAAKAQSAVTLKKAEAAGIADDVRELATAFEQSEKKKGSLEEKVLALESERATILARLGQHEAELKRANETSRALERELRVAASAKKPAEESVAAGEANELRRKLRRVEKQAAFVREREKDRDHVKLLEAERDALTKEIGLLRTQLNLAAALMSAGPGFVAPSEPRKGTGEDFAEKGPGKNRVEKGAEKGPGRVAAEGRTGIFVDGANLAGAARHLYGRKIDFAALRDALVAGGESASLYAYVIDNGADGFDAFSRALKTGGWQVKKRTPKILPDGSQKADQDVEIAVDVMDLRAQFQRVVIVSGDSDFLPLVRALRRAGVRTEAAMFRARAAKEIVAEVDAFIPLGETILV